MLLDCSVHVYNQPRFSASQLSPPSAHLGFAVGTVGQQNSSQQITNEAAGAEGD